MTIFSTRCTRQESESRGRHRHGSRDTLTRSCSSRSSRSSRPLATTRRRKRPTTSPTVTSRCSPLTSTSSFRLSFPLLKRSLADSKQELHALSRHVGVRQRDCTAAFSQHLREIHPAYVFSGQHRFTTDEANALDIDQFRTDPRWRTGGSDVNLVTLANEAAKNLNRSRPRDAPQLTGDVVLKKPSPVYPALDEDTRRAGRRPSSRLPTPSRSSCEQRSRSCNRASQQSHLIGLLGRAKSTLRESLQRRLDVRAQSLVRLRISDQALDAAVTRTAAAQHAQAAVDRLGRRVDQSHEAVHTERAHHCVTRTKRKKSEKKSFSSLDVDLCALRQRTLVVCALVHHLKQLGVLVNHSRSSDRRRRRHR
jgi:hypothetical protein